jgi:hypothetical protein
MRQTLAMPVRAVMALAATMAILLPAAPIQAQTTQQGSPTATIWIDSPAEGSTVNNGTQTLIGGWAVDTAGPGSGISEVRVYLDARMESGGVQIGTATYGKPRPDVGNQFGNAAYSNSGYDLLWTPSNVSPGPHTIYVYARSTASNLWSFKTASVTFQGPPAPSGQGPRYDNPYLNNPYYNDRYRADSPYYNNPFYPDYYRPPYPGGYPPYPYPPMYPPYPPSGGGQNCILIYPPPPGC